MNWKQLAFSVFSILIIGSSALASTDTLHTYVDLRQYSGVSDSIYVDHSRYYGVFYKDSCTAENFGTNIRSTGLPGICWRRMTHNFSPRFWEIGGASPDNIVGIVEEEVDAINSAAMAAFLAGGDTIEIDKMYEIDQPVYLMTHNTYLGIGDSAGFKRKASPKTVLTAPTQIGDDSIKVQSNVGFRNRNKINIANAQAYDSIAGFVSYNIYLSNNLGNDSTIYISGRKIQKAMNVGDSVGLFFMMMRPRFTQLDSVYLKNLVFDGNRSSYTLNYDWRVATTIMLTSTNEAIIEDCRFYETPAENIFLCGATFKNCSGENMNGSILHFSCQPNRYETNVLYNTFKKVNEVPDAIMSHSEAGFTFSAKVRNLRVAYNTIDDIGEHGVGRFSNDDYNNEITDNLLNTDKDEVNFLAFYTSPDSNIVYNNKNLNKADSSAGSCITRAAEPRGISPCTGNSSFQSPLNLGDTVSIHLDSLWMLNSNENFVKSILPVLDTSYFQLQSIAFDSLDLSMHHQWKYDSITNQVKGLVFDNGHESGLYGKGNWGFEKCGEDGGCNNLSLSFLVSKLPPLKQTVACPIKGLEIKYDGEVNSWGHSILCTNQSMYFDSTLMGSPVLDGQLITNLKQNSFQENKELNIYPNPANNQLTIDLPLSQVAYWYRIINVLGAIQQEGEMQNRVISISNLPSGIFYLELISSSDRYRQSFVKNTSK